MSKDLPYIPETISSLLPAGILRKTLEIEGHTIHYLEKGRGIPVFLMHGNPTWSFIYRNIISGLNSESFRCIAPDLVGLGFSSKPGDPTFHTLENHQRIISKFLAETIHEDFIFVGQDWGGPIGLLASMNSTHHMKGMVLMNTMIRPPKKDFRPTFFHSFSRMPIISDVTFRVFQFPQRYLHRVQGDPGSISGVVKKAYIYPLRKFSENKAPLMLARMVPNSFEHPSISLLKKTQAFASTFRGPVSLVWGKKDPILGRLASAHQQIMPHATLQLTEGGHFIQEEYPELISKEIAALLDK